MEPVTAIPPPRGVGTRCDDRSFGRSSTARCRRSEISAQVAIQHKRPVAIATTAGDNASAIPRWLTSAGLIRNGFLGLAAQRPTHRRTFRPDRSAQHHLLGLPRLARTEINALAEAHLGAGDTQSPEHSAG